MPTLKLDLKLAAASLGGPMKVRVGAKVFGVPAFSRTIVLDAGGGPIAYVETVNGDLHALTSEGEVNLSLELHQAVRDLLDHGFAMKL